METVTLKLPVVTLRALSQIARTEDVTVGQIVRGAIARDLRRRADAKAPDRADKQLVAPLRALLADDLAYSTGWEELAKRLSTKGYELREAGGGLVLCELGGERLCKASDLGYSYRRLMQAFKAPFPGHAHRWQYEQMRAGSGG